MKRKLVGIEISDPPLTAELAEPWPVRHDGRPVGRVTDAIHSPRLEKNIGYAWVPIELAEPSTGVDVETPDGMAPAKVASLPFLDPRKQIPAS